MRRSGLECHLMKSGTTQFLKIPTMILVATLLSNTEMVEKRTDSFVKRVLKDKDFDVVATISGDNYQYPVISNTTKSNHNYY